jgi:excisionase family DNA binding protein
MTGVARNHGADSGSAISAAVERVDRIQITTDMGRMLVHWLGNYAELALQRYGCTPQGLIETQHAIAEAVVGDSRQREAKCAAVHELLSSRHGSDVDTARAAELLGIEADTIRWHIREGNLHAHKVGRQWMVTVASIEEMMAEGNIQ